MGRVILIPFVLLFIDNYSPLRSFIAALLYLVTATTDFLDGYLARRYGQVSVLGKFLDPLADSWRSRRCWCSWWPWAGCRPGWWW
jgi:CDP-diacylglycerol--glycerol-3-phosphate 3-phosphatidyltransferase